MDCSVLLVVSVTAEFPNEVPSHLAFEIIKEIQGTQEQDKHESGCQGWSSVELSTLPWALQLATVPSHLKGSLLT